MRAVIRARLGLDFFGNHDTTRFLNEAHGSLPRLREALGPLTTLRGAAELYSGDEIAMLGGEDPSPICALTNYPAAMGAVILLCSQC